MQRTNDRRFVVSTRVLAATLALLVVGACSESPEQKLRDAGKELAAAQEDAQNAKQKLGDEQKQLEETKMRLEKDRQAASDAQQRVATAQAEVRLYGTDEIVFREVQRRLLDDSKLQDTAVSVGVNQGVVTLTGDVARDEFRTRAGELAKGSPGVVSVVNEIQVGGASATKPAPTPEASAPNAEPTAKAEAPGDSP